MWELGHRFTTNPTAAREEQTLKRMIQCAASNYIYNRDTFFNDRYLVEGKVSYNGAPSQILHMRVFVVDGLIIG